jgi:tetratricopeptide (TPR) repeat protein
VAVALRSGCMWAVLGDVGRSAGVLRVRGQLVEVATRRVVAEKSAEGSLGDFVAVQDRLARSLAAVLVADDQMPDRSRRETSVEAHECYTRARVMIDRLGKASLEAARLLLQHAIAIDPSHVDALAALTMTHGLRAIADPNAGDYETAVSYADRALSLEPRHVRANVWKGYALGGLGRLDEGDDALSLALHVDPHDTDALYFAATFRLLLWRTPAAADAAALLQRAVEIDPSHGMWWLALGTAHRHLGGLREAHYSFERARRLEDTAARFTTAGAAAYVADTSRRQGQLTNARAEALAGLEAAERSDHAYRDTFRAHALAVLGRVALDQGNRPGAEAAFRQVLAQAHGRPRPRACGHFVVQALSGLARATEDATAFLEARTLYEAGGPYNFGRFYGALDEDTVGELAQAADSVGRPSDAQRLRELTGSGASPSRAVGRT